MKLNSLALPGKGKVKTMKSLRCWDPSEITVAEQFKKQAYKTFMVGKWHLGTEPEFHPMVQGFDSYYGMPCNFAHSPKFFDGKKEVFARTPLARLTELYTRRITKIIRKQGDQPFFLYYAHNYPHTPLQAGKMFKGSSQDGVRGDVIQELDWSIGEMMKALKEAGIADNTVVFFTSDNGPTANQYAKPFRGTKYVTFEGGHRVPFILHWPTKIKQLPFWDKNKVFVGTQHPVLYNLRTDRKETSDLASANPEIVQEMLEQAESIRRELGEYMQRGSQQRRTGSVIPGAPIISHEKDWGMVAPATAEAIARERQKRHPNENSKKVRLRRKKQK